MTPYNASLLYRINSLYQWTGNNHPKLLQTTFNSNGAGTFSEQGSRGQSPQRLAILWKIIHFRHVLAEILPKNLKTCSLLYVSVLKCCVLAIMLFKYYN